MNVVTMLLLTTGLITVECTRPKVLGASQCIPILHRLTCLVNNTLTGFHDELTELHSSTEDQENHHKDNQQQIQLLHNQMQEIYKQVDEIKDQMLDFMEQTATRIDNLEALYSLQNTSIVVQNKTVPSFLPKDCQEIKSHGRLLSGEYTIYPVDIQHPIHVYCDMSDNGGGWTVIQKRQDGSVNFTQDWNAYKQGFGTLVGEFWLGNDNIASITGQESKSYTLRVVLTDFTGNKGYAEYRNFHVGREEEGYELNAVFVDGNAGDALTFHNGQKFSTYDVDNDADIFGNCAEFWQSGGFWFNDCFMTCLHCPYSNVPYVSYGHGIVWASWLGMTSSLQATELKIRPS